MKTYQMILLVLLFLALIVTVILLFRRKRKNKEERIDDIETALTYYFYEDWTSRMDIAEIAPMMELLGWKIIPIELWGETTYHILDDQGNLIMKNVQELSQIHMLCTSYMKRKSLNPIHYENNHSIADAPLERNHSRQGT